MTDGVLKEAQGVKEKSNFGCIYFLVTVLMIYPLPQMAIDVYLPSWPHMSLFFGVGHYMLQLSLTIYLLFLGVSQIMYGTLCDFFCRKKLLNFGVGLFVLGSLGCIMAHNIWVLIFFRGIQALGLGCGFTIASSLLADAYSGKDLARVLSYSAMIYAISLIVAPVIGSFIEHYLSWQYNFWLMIVYATILLVLIQVFVHLPSFEKQSDISLKLIIGNYLEIIKSKVFWFFCFCLIFAYGAIVVFNLMGPFLLMQEWHVSVIDYGFCLLIVGVAYFLGSMINGKTLKQGVDRNIFFGVTLLMTASIALLVFNFFSIISLKIMIGLIALGIFSIGFIYPNCFSIIMDLLQGKSYASSLVGSMILLGVSLIGSMVSFLSLTGLLDLSLTFLALSVISLICLVLGVRLKNQG